MTEMSWKEDIGQKHESPFFPAADLWHVQQHSEMFKNNIANQQLSLKALIKNVEKMSSDLKKMDELTNLLLCDLILHFSHPVKTEVIAEVEENNTVSEEFKMSDNLELVPILSNNI
ncbi:putative uncharacterized protein C5orf58 homolog [Gracilinanus agilis]|uniref:putative uncharacterized protein C5orf58 homolog n=1 Tax=Gracilinanus agilis TaxID=191870 RepID=UPI001CFD314B|nr:putative uncharacterized protein C5orf58 homolog [Gracilinanus agilis]